MNWTWRGEYVPASRSEYELVKTQLESEWIRKGERHTEEEQEK